MSNTCVVGLAWGDEAKGKIVDYLCKDHDICVRYNGGANAGHTVVKRSKGEVEPRVYKSHLLPVGAFSGLDCYMTAGMVIDPVQLVKEIEEALLKKLALAISYKAHIVLPEHKEMDLRKGGAKAIGTTGRGIGPCYGYKADRLKAMRMEDFMGESVGWAYDRFGHEYGYARQKLEMHICDAESQLRNRIGSERVLFESANGIQLDIDHGTYPYVTSSAVGPAAIPQSCALPNLHLDKIVGVTKCYMTRVGNGPFPSEIDHEDTANRIRHIGNEYGTTTGRPRRIGWLDLKILCESKDLTGATEIALTHADTVNEIFEAGLPYYTKEGKKQFAQNLDELISVIESSLEIPVTLVGTGPETNQIIER